MERAAPEPQVIHAALHDLDPLDDLEQVAAVERAYAAAADSLLDCMCGGGGLAEAWPVVLRLFASVAHAELGRLWSWESDGLVLRAELGSNRPSGELGEPLAVSALGLEPVEAWPIVALQATAEAWPGRLPPRGGGSALRVLLRSEAGPLAAIMLEELQGPVGSERALERLTAFARRAGAALAERARRSGLEQSLRARDDMLGAVAHDLRNPLNVISTATTMLLERQPDTRARRPLERILRSAHRAEHLIDDLLDVSAIESGHFSVDPQPCDAVATVLAAIELQQGLAANSSVILSSDLAPGLPRMLADGERVLEVLENLVGNAVKFTPAGGSIEIGARPRGKQLLFWVKDTGCGIPAEHQPRLFDRFWQAARGDRRGAGLGLTICRAIVEAHGGRIWIESEPSAGTTAFFTLPALEPIPGPDIHETANILLVDDRRENLLSLKAVLERPEYRLVTASTGEEALRCVLRETFAVVLMDIAMPGMDGLEVATHLKTLERSRDVPIIFITAFGDDPAEIHRAYSAGGADYLVKPLDPEIVRRKVAVFVDLNRQQRQRDRAAAAFVP